MYPIKRNRRLRSNESIRSLVRETILTPHDFLVPLFVVEGKGVKSEYLPLSLRIRNNIGLDDHVEFTTCVVVTS